MSETKVRFNNGSSVILDVEPESVFQFTPSWSDKAIFLSWVSETSIFNLIQLRILKFGLTWPFISWLDYITDRI